MKARKIAFTLGKEGSDMCKTSRWEESFTGLLVRWNKRKYLVIFRADAWDRSGTPVSGSLRYLRILHRRDRQGRFQFEPYARDDVPQKAYRLLEEITITDAFARKCAAIAEGEALKGEVAQGMGAVFCPED